MTTRGVVWLFALALASCEESQCEKFIDLPTKLSCCFGAAHMGWPNRKDEKFCTSAALCPAVESLRQDAEKQRGNRYMKGAECSNALLMIDAQLAPGAKPWVMDICCGKDPVDMCQQKPPWPRMRPPQYAPAACAPPNETTKGDR